MLSGLPGHKGTKDKERTQSMLLYDEVQKKVPSRTPTTTSPEKTKKKLRFFLVQSSEERPKKANWRERAEEVV